MEPIAALSLASNVIQVVDFTARIVSKSSELYRSSNGRLLQHTDIATTSSDLKRLTVNLSNSFAPDSIPTVLSEDEASLYTLCKGCIDISEQLQAGLNKLQTNGAPSKWKSLRKALKSIWGREHIADLQSRVAEYRAQLDSRILIGLKSKLEGLEIRQAQGFDKFEDSIKSVMESLANTSDGITVSIERQAALTDATISHVHIAQENIREAVEITARSHQHELQSVEAKLTLLHTTDEQNIEGTHKSRDDVIASIASSTAAASEDHEQTRDELTQQWQSAEGQIVSLREELREIRDLIGENARAASSSRARPDSEHQRRLIERTNLLYKVMIAKDIMLQTLLELVEAIKSRLSQYTKAISSVKWTIDPNRTARMAAKWSIVAAADHASSKLQFKLFKAVEAGSLSMMPEPSDLNTVVNNKGPVVVALQDLEPQTALFYSTMTGSAVGVNDEERHDSTTPPESRPSMGLLRAARNGEATYAAVSPSEPAFDVSSEETGTGDSQTVSNDLRGYTLQSVAFRDPKNINIEMTALTWALFALRLHDSETRCAVLDVLIDAGADRQARDRTGLCAYDHARILGLDNETTGRLNPFVHVHAGVSFGILDAIRKHQPQAALSLLSAPTRANVLDKMNQSPIALAIHEGLPGVLGFFLRAGFSPFAGYISATDYHPSIAVAHLMGSNVSNDVDDVYQQVKERFEEWVNSSASSAPSLQIDQEWTIEALNIQRNAAEGSEATVKAAVWGDFCVLAALLDQTELVRTCLERPATLTGLPADSLAWSLYAAIRCGNPDLVNLLMRHDRWMMSRSLDQRHFLSSWWPWPCTCEGSVHYLGSRTLFEYAKSLKRVQSYNAYPDCDWCNERAFRYRLYEIPGDIPARNESDGKALSGKEAIAHRQKVYNGVDSSSTGSGAETRDPPAVTAAAQDSTKYTTESYTRHRAFSFEGERSLERTAEFYSL